MQLSWLINGALIAVGLVASVAICIATVRYSIRTGRMVGPVALYIGAVVVIAAVLTVALHRS